MRPEESGSDGDGMLIKQIRYIGETCLLACDGRCDKAWGINGRPKVQLSEDPDDYVFKGDDELDIAPGPMQTVGLTEGGEPKPSAEPLTDATKMNKWCTRECERSTVAVPGEQIRLRDMSNPEPNIPRRR